MKFQVKNFSLIWRSDAISEVLSEESEETVFNYSLKKWRQINDSEESEGNEAFFAI